ncbi:kinase-like protein [Piromyces finnis]|uniref:non-specific serine/threonine protein kinase n=1 Tax=Piromyces finnis TaxID=1754191 RepID=A0A1Y1V0B8_9FUNG|nr:kinase-like protein [Piromyces finnis]|eukprot:ORX44509.1 kinase-like protein [Piromyces finnis]
MQVQRIETPNLSIKNYWYLNNAKTILESLTDPMLILDEYGTILEVNSYAEELFEYSREELIGNINISKLIPYLNLDNEELRSNHYEKSIITSGLRKLSHSNNDTKINKIDIDISIACLIDKDDRSTSTNNVDNTAYYIVSVRDITRQLTEIEWTKSRYYTEFKEIKCIGKGGFGSVYLAKNKLDEQVYAIKKIPLQCHPQDYIECMNMMNSDEERYNKDEYGCSSANCSKYQLYDQEEDDYHENKDEKIVEQMKTSLTLDDLRVIREVKNFAKFKSHPNVVRYYASWVEPVLLNDDLQKVTDSKVNSAQPSQENIISPFDHVHPNTPIASANEPGMPNENYSIYDSIENNPNDSSSNVIYSKTNKNYLNQNQNQSHNNYTTSNSSNTNNCFEKEDEDFDIFGNGPSDLRMITSLPKSFIEDSNNNCSPLQQLSTQSSYNQNSKEREILNSTPSSFEVYSSFDANQSTNSSISHPKNINSENKSISSHSIPLCSGEKPSSDSKSKNGNLDNINHYNINVRNFYKNCDNQHSFLNDTIEGQSYNSTHDSHCYNNIMDSLSRNDQSGSHYTSESYYEHHPSDSSSTLSDDDESSLTLMELPVINTSNEEINMLSSSQTNLNNYSEIELTTTNTTDDSIAGQNSDSQTFDNYGLDDKEEIVTQFSEKNDDIFLTEHEEESCSSRENDKLPIVTRDTFESFENCPTYNCVGITIPNKNENKFHQSDNETCNSYNSTYSNNSIKTMLLDNQFSIEDHKEQMLKTQNTINEEEYFSNTSQNNVKDDEHHHEEYNNNSNNIEFNNTNSNGNYDDEFSTGSSVSTIVDDCDLAKNTIYQIPANTMLYIQMEYSSPNNLRKWIRERNAKIWKHAPFLNNEEDVHVKHSKHWFLDYINRKKNLTILSQITTGLEHIHKSGFIHRDIKPANIFMNDDRVMIGDFGLAKRYVKGNSDCDINDLAIADKADNEDHVHHLKMLMKEEITNDNNNCSMKTMKSGGESDLTLGVGTLLYASPEQLSRKPYSFATDIYSLSVIMLELFFPFCTSFDRMAHLVNLRKGEIPDFLKKRWPEECNLLLSMANVDPYQRPTATEILQTLNQLLTNQPARISSINSLYLPKRYNLYNPVFHSTSSATTIREIDSQSEESFVTSNYIEDQTINNIGLTGSPEMDEGVISDFRSIHNGNEKNNERIKEGEEEKNREDENEKIDLLINKLHQLQLINNYQESSLNDVINPVLEILSKKRDKMNLRSNPQEYNGKELNSFSDGNTNQVKNSSKSLDNSLSFSSSGDKTSSSEVVTVSDEHKLQFLINGVEASIDHEEDFDDITPQPSKIRSTSSSIVNDGRIKNQSQQSLSYIENKGYKLGTSMNDPLLSPPLTNHRENSNNHLSATNYVLFMPDKNPSYKAHSHANLNSYNNLGRRRNSYSPTHSNEYYLNKLKGIDHDSYYLTSPPSTSQHEGLIYQHEQLLSGQKFIKINNNRRSSLPNPNRLSYNQDYSSSSSSSENKPSSSSLSSVHRSNKVYNTVNNNSISEEEVYNTYHSNSYFDDGSACQCEKCNEHESLVLGLLAENATLAKRIKELERRINNNNNCISPFGYHRNGKLK